MKLLDGKALAEKQRLGLKRRVAGLKRRGVKPSLAVVMVGNHPASAVYVKNKARFCEGVGVEFRLHQLPANASQQSVLAVIEKLNRQRLVHGIIVQLPLPAKLDELNLIAAIDPRKDVDGLHPLNVGLLAYGRELFGPATPQGILALLDEYKVALAGKVVAMVGYGRVVGLPMSLMLSRAGATVVVAHQQTKDLPGLLRTAQIVITAVGKPGLITGTMLKPGVVVIDAGISQHGGKFVGDVDFASAAKVASLITPVPGGVGPLTVSSLVANVTRAAGRL